MRPRVMAISQSEDRNFHLQPWQMFLMVNLVMPLAVIGIVSRTMSLAGGNFATWTVMLGLTAILIVNLWMARSHAELRWWFIGIAVLNVAAAAYDKHISLLTGLFVPWGG